MCSWNSSNSSSEKNRNATAISNQNHWLALPTCLLSERTASSRKQAIARALAIAKKIADMAVTTPSSVNWR